MLADAAKRLQLQAAVSLATAGVPLNDGHLVTALEKAYNSQKLPKSRLSRAAAFL